MWFGVIAWFEFVFWMVVLVIVLRGGLPGFVCVVVSVDCGGCLGFWVRVWSFRVISSVVLFCGVV